MNACNLLFLGPYQTNICTHGCKTNNTPTGPSHSVRRGTTTTRGTDTHRHTTSLNLLPRQIPRRKALDTLTELCCARHRGLTLNNPTHCSRWQRAVCESEGVPPLTQAEARRRTSSTHVSTLRFRRCMFSAASVSVCREACETRQWETWASASFALHHPPC